MLDVIIKQIATIVTDPKFLSGVIVAVLVGLATKLGHWLWSTVLHSWHNRRAFDIKGYWIGQCILPSYKPKVALEIWRYARNGERISLKFFSYMPDTQDVSKWLGGGVWRGTKLSAYYYRDDRFTFESGVIALELKELVLQGAYAQFDLGTKGGPLYVSDSSYIQNRIRDLSRWARLKMWCGCSPLSTYNEVKALYDKIVPQPAPPIAEMAPAPLVAGVTASPV